MIEPGSVLLRIWGDGFMETEMRVSDIDDQFVYCDAQRDVGATEWQNVIRPPGTPWKFDIVYGVETDVEQGWGIATPERPTLRNIILSRVVIPERSEHDAGS